MVRRANSEKPAYIQFNRENRNNYEENNERYNVKEHVIRDRTESDNRKCYNCNKIGHISRECKEKRDVTCYGCGNKGHIARDCKDNQSKSVVRCFGCQEMGQVSKHHM